MKSATPEQRKEIAVQRAAGHTLAQISARTGFSFSTIQRICKRNDTKKGELQDELVQKAKKDLLEESFGDDALQAQLKMHIADLLAHSMLGREKLAMLLEDVKTSDDVSAYQAMRAVAAHSTALKNYSDTIRHALPEFEVKSEPEEFVVTVITEEEVAQMRKEQEEEDKF